MHDCVLQRFATDRYGVSMRSRLKCKLGSKLSESKRECFRMCAALSCGIKGEDIIYVRSADISSAVCASHKPLSSDPSLIVLNGALSPDVRTQKQHP